MQILTLERYNLHRINEPIVSIQSGDLQDDVTHYFVTQRVSLFYFLIMSLSITSQAKTDLTSISIGFML